eukprot:Seg2604.5 transcript_id=Seg2604.5/GoldUCD/mRNA.D3Y31 product="Ubiquitin carboxyl-terminal hydrolase 5" protein_id=Seg2604.5/GoldUCD/D3Y31
MASFEFLKKVNYFIPRGGDKVYKDECMLCYQTPFSDGGLFVSFNNLQGFCQEHVKSFTQKSGKDAFLHLKKVPKPITADDAIIEPDIKKPTRLAIGVEGGFDLESSKVQYDDVNSVVIVEANGAESDRIQLPHAVLPEMTLMAISGILAHQGAAMQDNIASWEGEKRMVSKHADNLLQLANGVKVPPRGWKCSKCDLVDNLWMNLTDGTILCGRKYFDGSGGNNHAVEYYQETQYPLAVKLGTINPDGADVYSYDEDDMVEDPKLTQHLEHFGINISKMEKSDKTMTELEIEANLTLKAEWDTIQESGKKLKPLNGPGYTGMINLGNSCYMNSVMQVLFSTDEFKARYSSSTEEIYGPCNGNPAEDFEIQISKLAHGLLSGKYSPLINEENPDAEEPGRGIRPLMFKSLVGKGHAEFASNRQQDAQEYLLHVLSMISRQVRVTGKTDLRQSFAFEFEDRLQCVASRKVSYTKREDIAIMLPIPLEKTTNQAEFDAFEKRRKEAETSKQRIDPSEIVRPKISMASCLEAFAEADIIDNFHSTAINGLTQASRITRFATFPNYLVIQLRKFTVGDDWVPKKLDVSVDVPDELDISQLRGKGLQPGEEELPPSNVTEPQEPAIDENVVRELAAMGFAFEGCRKAVYHTKNTGVESAMEWVLQHMGDPDFASPFQIAPTSSNASKFTPNEEALVMIQSMGFAIPQATKALKATDNNLERAIDWLFSHAGEIDDAEMEVDSEGGQATSAPTYNDGPGKYRLFAFISHMGTSTSCGHYVCHIHKDGRWVIFNDRKVAVSENPPKDLAYIYFYKRVSSS